MPTHCNWSRAGFTLIELVVVLLIVGIALAVAAPSLPRGPGGGDRAAGELVRLLVSARSEAALRGSETAVTVDLATGAYRVVIRGAGAADSTLLAGGIREWAVAAAGMRARDSLLVARFDPVGYASATPLRWERSTGGRRALVVDPWTGEVRVAAR